MWVQNVCKGYQQTTLTGKVVVVLGFYVPPTAKVIRRRDLGLKSHPKDWRSPGSHSGPLVYKAGSLTARPRRLLTGKVLPVVHVHVFSLDIKFQTISMDCFLHIFTDQGK